MRAAAVTLTLTAYFCLVAAPLSRAASITVTGTGGVEGAPADIAGGVPAADGGDGESVSAIADTLDPTNQARAAGGTGGNGGDGTGSPFPDGAGGVGGAALSVATSVSTTQPVSAQAYAEGGDGGFGSNDGAGGAAEARSAADSSAGSAEAFSLADGGNGPGRLRPSRGGVGTALATAQSHAFADSSAVAGASGSHAQATSDSTSENGEARANSNAFGALGAAAALVPSDAVPLATATARSLGAGPASASAIAYGSASREVAPGVFEGGASRATAEAYANSGPAAATAKQVAGGPPASGGPGNTSEARDLVRGATTGTLSLHQDAIGSASTAGYTGGSGISTLAAANPAGGDLEAESFAYGGGGSTCIGSGSPDCRLGRGGDALASVVASGAPSARVSATAQTFAGLGGTGLSGVEQVVEAGGSADASATAAGGREQFAAAYSLAQAGAAMQSAARVVGSGGVASAEARLQLAALPGNPSRELDQKALNAFSALSADARFSAVPLVEDVAIAGIAARPRQTDVDVWVAGNPNTQAALAERGALALGSLGSSLSNHAPGHDPAADETLGLAGSASLELTASAFAAGSSFGLALLDPTGSFALLELSIDRDGTQLFHETLSGNADSLDDVIVELGQLGTPIGETSTYTLSWLFRTPSGDPAQLGDSFGLDFAFLGPSPVPEPAGTLLALAVLALAMFARRSS